MTCLPTYRQGIGNNKVSSDQWKSGQFELYLKSTIQVRELSRIFFLCRLGALFLLFRSPLHILTNVYQRVHGCVKASYEGLRIERCSFGTEREREDYQR